MFLSERATADRNFSMGYFMKEQRCFPDKTDLHETLDLYFQSCSLEAREKRNGSIPYGDHQCSELKSVFSKKQGKCVQKKEYYIKTQLQVSGKEKKALCFT